MAPNDSQIRDVDYEAALKSCSQDPIHVPGHIQSFGYLIAADKKFETILFASENISEIFPVTAAKMIGQKAMELLDREDLHQIRNVLGHEGIDDRREVLAQKDIGGREFQVTLHRKGDRAILEYVEEQLPFEGRAKNAERSRAFLNFEVQHDRLNTFFEDAVEYIRLIAGFDRVKFYRFLHDGSGEVVAEARHPGMASYLGLRFPASDVPENARKLYAATPIRAISDVMGPDVAVIGDETSGPLDLSLAVLRGKNGVHRQYLENMGVAATLTVPVVIDGALWGLFACHHPKPVNPDPSVLNALELAGRLIGLRVQHALELQRQELRTRCLTTASRLTSIDVDGDVKRTSGAQVIDDVLSLLPCDAVVLAVGELTLASSGVELSEARSLLDVLQTDQGEIAIDDIQTRFDGAKLGGAVTALAFSVDGAPSIRVAFLRRAAKAAITWAGQAKKDITFESDGPKLHPRGSFEKYLEIVEDRALAWETEDFEMARAFRHALKQTVAAQLELRESQNRQVVMARELNHRVRNILTLVQSMSLHAQLDGASLKENASALELRILALVGSQNRLAGATAKGTSIWETLRLEADLHGHGDHLFRMSGPDVHVLPEASSVLSVVVHELATNSASFGVLSAQTGKINVTWTLQGNALRLSWQETGGPTYPKAVREGFAASIIREAVPYEVGGTSKLEFNDDGLSAEFTVPEDHIVQVSENDKPSNRISNALEGYDRSILKRALVVEDNYIIAKMVQRLLIEAGFSSVDIAARFLEGQEKIENEQYDFCLLDINLGDESGTSLARVLNEKKIPFAFATGYSDDATEYEMTYGVPVLAKPLDIQGLGSVLKTLLEGASARG
jgi:light-regulated signal transduction histidine kinase (bacteriophytochrome)